MLRISIAAFVAFAAPVYFCGEAKAETVTVAPGKLLCVRLDNKAKMKIGAGVSGTLAETVYVGDKIAIPSGTRLVGHVADLIDGPTIKHVKSIMDGDFTPPHNALVQFDYVVAADGTWLTVHTKPALGISNEADVTYSETGDKSTPDPKIDREIKQHIEDALEHKLPYHPEHVARGDVFHCELVDPLEVVSQGTAVPQKDALLAIQLLTPLDTATAELNQPVQAMVSEPYFTAEGKLLFPEGTRIAGRVTDAYSAGMLQHQGRLRRVQYASQLLEQFFAKDTTKKALMMLDATTEIEIFPHESDPTKRCYYVDDDVLIEALRPEMDKGFASVPFAIRMIFDEFFTDLSMFKHHIDAGLLELGDVRPYLEYWIKSINGLGPVFEQVHTPELAVQINKFLQAFGYKAILELSKSMAISPRTPPSTR